MNSQIKITASDELVTRLKREAKENGLSLSKYCLRLIEGNTEALSAAHPQPTNETHLSSDASNIDKALNSIADTLESLVTGTSNLYQQQKDILESNQKTLSDIYGFMNYVNNYANVHDSKAAKVAIDHWKKTHEGQ